jgi:hypothetical protein
VTQLPAAIRPFVMPALVAGIHAATWRISLKATTQNR